MFKLAKRKRGTTSLALSRRTPFLRLTMVAGGRQHLAASRNIHSCLDEAKWERVLAVQSR